DYARDRPDVLAELLLDADAKQYAVLWPKLQRHREQAAARMRRELKALPDYWNDAPLDPAWQEPAPPLRREGEQAEGLFAGRFALCQALPLGRLRVVTEGLHAAGYRPLRVRPWRQVGNLPPRPEGLFVAVVWARDGRGWKLETGLTAQQVARRNAAA